MKKICSFFLILSASFITTAYAKSTEISYPCPQASQGFHLGGNMGYGFGGTKVTQVSRFPGVNSPMAFTTNNIRTQGVDGGLNVGILTALVALAWGLKEFLIGQEQKAIISHAKSFRMEQLAPQRLL